MTPEVAWCIALGQQDQRDSRLAIADYIRRDHCTELSVGQLIDALLLWYFDANPVSLEVAVPVVVAALDRPTLGSYHRLEQQTVFHLSERVLGWAITLPEGESGMADYRVLSRATVAGLYPPATSTNEALVSAARAACVMLHSCFYVQAAQALTVLCGQIHLSGEQSAMNLLVQFVDQSYAHLTALAVAHGSAQLSWELRLMSESRRG